MPLLHTALENLPFLLAAVAVGLLVPYVLRQRQLAKFPLLNTSVDEYIQNARSLIERGKKVASPRLHADDGGVLTRREAEPTLPSHHRRGGPAVLAALVRRVHQGRPAIELQRRHGPGTPTRFPVTERH